MCRPGGRRQARKTNQKIGADAAYDPITVHGEATRSAAPPSAKEFVTEVSWPGEADVPPAALLVASRLRSSDHVLQLLASGGRKQGAALNHSCKQHWRLLSGGWTLTTALSPAGSKGC